ncbi:MAG: B12-binding domain-containing protein, partial [Desulfotomaculales bacterium]
MLAEKEQELLEKLASGVVNFDEEQVREAATEWLGLGLDPNKAVFEGLVKGMQECGRLYEEQEYFVPELLMCADALYAGLDILKPHMKSEEAGVRGQVVMGVVQGDVHDIGKNLVKVMFEAAGFVVHDLGRDVPLEKFVEEQLRTDSDIVALSA